MVFDKSGSKFTEIDNLNNCKCLTDIDTGPKVCDGLSKLEDGRQKAIKIEIRTLYQQVSK